MYLIYFYSNITEDVIPKKTVSSINEIHETIMKDIYDMVVFEEGKRKADSLSIFKEHERILYEGLDDGLYIKQVDNKYKLYKKASRTIIRKGWISTYPEKNSDNLYIGFFSYVDVPNQPLPTNIIKIPIKAINKEVKQIVNNPKSEGGFEGVLNELKNKFKNA